jgi:hypothetical protein
MVIILSEAKSKDLRIIDFAGQNCGAKIPRLHFILLGMTGLN